MTPRTEEQIKLDNLIICWDKEKAMLNVSKKVEKELRDEILSLAFTQRTTGTNKHQLGQGYFLKATFPLSYSVSEVDKETIDAKLSLLPTEIAAQLITWKPSLNKKVYDILNEEQKNLISDLIVIRPSSETLELVKPKKE
jgi:hypothetical protein